MTLRTLEGIEEIDFNNPEDGTCSTKKLRELVIRHIKSGNMVEGAKFWAVDFFNLKDVNLE